MYPHRLRCTEDLEHDHEPEEMLTDNESSEDAYDHDDQTNESDEDLSEYEIRRKHRIAANKKKFEEHYAAIIAKKVKVYRYTYKKRTLSVMYPL